MVKQKQVIKEKVRKPKIKEGEVKLKTKIKTNLGRVIMWLMKKILK